MCLVKESFLKLCIAIFPGPCKIGVYFFSEPLSKMNILHILLVCALVAAAGASFTCVEENCCILAYEGLRYMADAVNDRGVFDTAPAWPSALLTPCPRGAHPYLDNTVFKCSVSELSVFVDFEGAGSCMASNPNPEQCLDYWFHAYRACVDFVSESS